MSGVVVKPFDVVIAHSRVIRVTRPGSQHRFCPGCSSGDLRCLSNCSTLLGGGDGTEDGDPNHRTQEYECRPCGLRFDRHAKYANVWYAVPRTGLLLAGVATCFEKFDYPCVCSTAGVIQRRYTKMDGITKTNTLSWGQGQRYYRTFWSCVGCGFDVETVEDYARTGNT